MLSDFSVVSNSVHTKHYSVCIFLLGPNLLLLTVRVQQHIVIIIHETSPHFFKSRNLSPFEFPIQNNDEITPPSHNSRATYITI